MSAIGNSLSLLALAALADEARNKPAPLIEAQIATLKEVADRYFAGCPFVEGDIVTPRSGTNYKDIGIPHIVLEVRDPPFFNTASSDANSSSFGQRLDMRVAAVSQNTGNVAAWWVESWAFEPFADFAARSGKAAEPAAAADAAPATSAAEAPATAA